MLGGLGPYEDIPPGPDDLQPELFDFFGFGQQGPDPNPHLTPHQQSPEPAHEGQEGGWGLRPQGPGAHAQQDAEIVHAIPAAQPLNFDLNQPLEQVDDDLGVVENVFPGFFQPPHQPVEPMEEDIIVASSDSKGGAAMCPFKWQKSSKMSLFSSPWTMVFPCS
jgi:hypothetical protein